ncbi:MAG TPA: substrate-binding domain-containing protein [Steroidobacteraceae bacterium]|jgi:ABC-type molybdate transport system substrate-binding protein
MNLNVALITFVAGALLPLAVSSTARADGATATQPAATVEIFAAGSLRGVVADLGKDAAAFNIEVKSSFGGSGLMRERIEKGEKPDLFLSADVGHPRKLETEGRTFVPVAAFARNRMCIVSRKSAKVTAANLVDRLLAKDLKLKTSAPVVDPGGDYAWWILDHIDAKRPGAGAVLKAKAQTMMSANADAADIQITYCSAAATRVAEHPDLTRFQISADLDPHPLYGMAVLSNKPEAMRLALYLLSEKGQAVLTHNGLVPVTE